MDSFSKEYHLKAFGNGGRLLVGKGFCVSVVGT